MKKIGILHGKERSFPEAFVARINSKNVPDVVAESVRIDKAMQGMPSGYAVIIDRISQDVPFYRTWLKNAAVTGTAVINNPFWWSADDKYFNNCLMTKVDVPVPKTAIIPSRDLPDDTTDESFSNLAYPLDWDTIFNYVGFPAYMKPFAGGGWKHVYRLDSAEDFFKKHSETGQLVMLLQEEIVFDEYYRCYCIGGKYVRIMPYEPRNPHHLRYVADFSPSPERLQQMTDIVLRINHYLGYDFNTVELALRNGVPYAIDFCNPAPDAERTSVGEENFEWVVETAANYAIEKALSNNEHGDNLTWGEYVKKKQHEGPIILMFTVYDIDNEEYLKVEEPDPSVSYTYADYLQWQFEERLELFRGRIFKLSAPNTKHQVIAGNILVSVKNYLGRQKCQVFIAPFDVRLPVKNRKKDNEVTTVVQPDICIVCDEQKIDTRGCCGAPDLVVEILSPGNSHKEIKLKFELYEEAGVKEYWIVYPEEESLAVFLLNENGRYDGATLYAGKDKIKSKAVPGFIIDTKEIFTP